MDIFKRFLLALIFVFVFSFPTAVSAHTQSMNGRFSGVMHINPNDSPIVGEQATIVLFIADSKNTFSFETCKCSVKVTSEDGFFNQTMLNKTGEAPMTFPRKGVYKAVFIGKTTNGQTLFELPYDIRVEREPENVIANNPSTNKTLLFCSIGCVVLLIGLAFVLVHKLWNTLKKSR